MKKLLISVTLFMILNCHNIFSNPIRDYIPITQETKIHMEGNPNNSESALNQAFNWVKNHVPIIIDSAAIILSFSAFMQTRSTDKKIIQLTEDTNTLNQRNNDLTQINNELNTKINTPNCRVKITAIGNSLDLRVENVGSGIMIIKKIVYSIEGQPEYSTGREELKKLVDSIIEYTATLSCEDVQDENLFPNSEHHVLKCTFVDWDNYVKAWEVLSKVTVIVDYNGILNNEQDSKLRKKLSEEYEIFKIATGKDSPIDQRKPAFFREQESAKLAEGQKQKRSGFKWFIST